MDKIRIGICDDEVADLIAVLQLAQEYDAGQQMHISIYVRAADLLAEAKNAAFDIALLDIEMEPPTGFDAAKELIALERPPVIIFTTKSSAYSLKGYGIALRYLQKPLIKADFYEEMDSAIREVKAHRFSFVVGNTMIVLPISDVQYIEMFGHYAIVHDANNEYRFRSTLKEIIAGLPKGYFAMPHKSILVNLEHIKSATSTDLLLDNGVRLPISRRKQQEFNQMFFGFLGR